MEIFGALFLMGIIAVILGVSGRGYREQHKPASTPVNAKPPTQPTPPAAPPPAPAPKINKKNQELKEKTCAECKSGKDSPMCVGCSNKYWEG